MLFGESKRYYIDRRVAERMAATGLSNFSDYFAMLRTEAGELELLINASPSTRPISTARSTSCAA